MVFRLGMMLHHGKKNICKWKSGKLVKGVLMIITVVEPICGLYHFSSFFWFRVSEFISWAHNTQTEIKSMPIKCIAFSITSF